jgi:hypothetical protein
MAVAWRCGARRPAVRGSFGDTEPEEHAFQLEPEAPHRESSDFRHDEHADRDE